MSKKKVLMQRFNGTDYDPQYPETHVQNITGVDQTVANNVGVATTDAATVIGEMSEIDYFVSPQGTTTGTSTAYVLTIGSQYTNLDDMDGVVVRVKFHTTTGDIPTLNVNGLGAKPILAENGANIPYQIGEGVWATLIWSSTLDGWVVQGWGKKKVFKTEIFTSTTTWTVPEDIDGAVNIVMFGGGGGGGGYNYQTTTTGYRYNATGGGGGGGYAYITSQKLSAGQNIPITIGAAGIAPTGAWYSRSNGGTGGTTSFGSYYSAGGGAGGIAGRAGTDASYGGAGGNGGAGGGGGSANYNYQDPSGTGPTYWYYDQQGGAGGRGGFFGGGGGGYNANGGDGGIYGGGGGSGGATAGKAETYGGDGASTGNGSAGTNTTNIADIPFRGTGAGGTGSTYAGGGGGGYGGIGGSTTGRYSGGGGGGGYGATGGSVTEHAGGGGGGGYGGAGGQASGGGGGGYGADNYGGGGDAETAGKSGICILTYWAWE